MLLSGRIALISWAVFFVCWLLAVATSPSISDFDGLGGSQDDFFAKAQTASFFGNIANISFLVAIISSIVFGFQKFMAKPMGNTIGTVHGSVHQGDVSASGRAMVAGAGATLTNYEANQTLDFSSQVQIQDTLKQVTANIRGSSVRPREAGEAVEMIEKASRDVGESEGNRLSTKRILEELYDRLQDSSIPAKLYKGIANLLS